MKLFISYSRDDKSYVYELADRLRDDGNHSIWIDKSALVGGDSWWESILQGIESSDSFLVILTPRSLSSIYCDAELRYALALQKPVLPLMLKSVDVPSHLSEIQAENISEISVDRAYGRCERALGNIALKLERGHFPPPVPPPPRPDVPVLSFGQNSEHVFEVYAHAVEALAQDEALARKLFEQVITADPEGLGVQAKERLAIIEFDTDRLKAYRSIERLAAKSALQDDAKRLWKAYASKYGTNYDPRGYAQTMGAAAAASGGHVQAARKAGDRWMDPKGVSMVYIPAGEFLMGSTREQVDDAFAQAQKENKQAEKNWFSDQMPQHRQAIQRAFWLDLTPVTNASYAHFVEAGGYYTDKFWTPSGWMWIQANNITGPKDYDGFTNPQQPRVGITWFEAFAYCRWRGSRLPTEAEWEWAARGPQNKLYPWGDSFSSDYVVRNKNYAGILFPKAKQAHNIGVAWAGAWDMCGSIREWCSSQYKPYPFNAGDGRENIEAANGKRILRGGAWKYDLTPTRRGAYRLGFRDNAEDVNWGFRCARAVDE